MANRERQRSPATPVGWLFDIVQGVVDLVPGARLVRRGLEAVEREVLRELKSRLEGLEAESTTAEKPLSPSSEAVENGAETPAGLLAALLDRSIEQTPDQARREAFIAILRELVPDEARILGALSDGGSYPVIHVTAGSTLGTSSRRVLSNVSPIGQAAGVQLREMTAHYVARLLEKGLVDLGPEDPELALKYEILESNTQVREAVREIERGEKMTRARIVRRTIRLTPLGRELWAASRPRDGAGSSPESDD